MLLGSALGYPDGERLGKSGERRLLRLTGGFDMPLQGHRVGAFRKPGHLYFFCPREGQTDYPALTHV